MDEMSDVIEWSSSLSPTCIWLRDLWLTHWVKVVSESVDQVWSSNVDQVGAAKCCRRTMDHLQKWHKWDIQFRQACSSHCYLDSRIGRRQCCLIQFNKWISISVWQIIMLILEPEGEEQHSQAFEGRVVLEPGWKFRSLLKTSVVGSLNTWKKDHDQTWCKGDHEEDGDNENLIMIRPHSKIKFFWEGVNVQGVI